MTRYRSSYLLRGGQAMDVLSDGVVDVEEGGITWSGPASDAPDSGGAEEIRVPGLLMPALINGHCHTPMVLFRGAGEGLPVDRWLSEVMWPRESRLTPADVHAGMALGVAEMLTNGIGTSSEMYFHADAMAAAVEEANFRSVISAAFIEDESFAGLGSVSDQMDSAVSFNERCADRRTVYAGLGPHSAYALSEDTLASIGRLAAEHHMLVHIHAGELPGENDMVASMGPTVVQVLDGLRVELLLVVLYTGVVLFHRTYAGLATVAGEQHDAHAEHSRQQQCDSAHEFFPWWVTKAGMRF